ncbi:YwhD-like protein [Cytobacillus horneckiae]|uniref:YwhD family protein n=1 Tax=Cytobacillus horneckiae TaxID=549687 RepID=A0A2N0ZG29_9BACI|nr:YwhD family protein [Cytobacillus horneckiae]NRG46159.1 YwhD family protein [Bacillus sp. CRN 9]MBN6884999.1 YwhD family protein [Cytobacillus horneckiae]MCM3179254.1 YwhD family protein [Cytobacillus horneckiae]MEC1154476.1 YwhD family protein [Cytobacillus horneckiae]MED2937811.1 YwhD family protein [Cytobacillus horneckiae]
MTEKKKKLEFNIIKNDPTEGHGGFGVGSLSLDNVSPVIIDVQEGEASIEIGAMHARSAVERGIKFLKTKEEVPNGKPYWLIWVTIDRKAEGTYYAGVTACEMTVDRSIRRGYKSLPEHVNRMDKSIKRHIIVDHMDGKSKKILAEFLQNHDAGMWERSSEQLKADLQV